jgi:hypothetical protein
MLRARLIRSLSFLERLGGIIEKKEEGCRVRKISLPVFSVGTTLARRGIVLQL